MSFELSVAGWPSGSANTPGPEAKGAGSMTTGVTKFTPLLAFRPHHAHWHACQRSACDSETSLAEGIIGRRHPASSAFSGRSLPSLTWRRPPERCACFAARTGSCLRDLTAVLARACNRLSQSRNQERVGAVLLLS